jgi:hypothetical protein
MRPTQFRHRDATSVFVSGKCEIAIPIHQQLLRYALQQASLEPSVHAIHYQTGPEPECPFLPSHCVVLDRLDGRFLLRACDARPNGNDDEYARLACALERYGLRLLERDASDIRREPLFSNARTVWSYARYNVSLADRLRIAVALEDGGPQSILELEERARPSCDIFAAICALACEDLVRLHIQHAPLGLSTIVFGQP